MQRQGFITESRVRMVLTKLSGSIYIPTVNDSIEARTIKTKIEIILFRKNLLVAIKYKSC